MRLLAIKKYGPGIAWFFVVAVLLFMPGSDMPKADDWLKKIYFDKIVHIGLFTVMGFLFSMPAFWQQKFKRVWLIIIIGSAWGLTTEFIQDLSNMGRSFDLGDWAADTTGLIIGYFLAKYMYGKLTIVK